jgi:hypothetical protein
MECQHCLHHGGGGSQADLHVRHEVRWLFDHEHVPWSFDAEYERSDVTPLGEYMKVNGALIQALDQEVVKLELAKSQAPAGVMEQSS